MASLRSRTGTHRVLPSLVPPTGIEPAPFGLKVRLPTTSVARGHGRPAYFAKPERLLEASVFTMHFTGTWNTYRFFREEHSAWLSPGWGRLLSTEANILTRAPDGI